MSSEDPRNPPEKDDTGVPIGNDDTSDDESRVRLELPEILCYDEIDRFLLGIEDLDDLLMIRLMLFAGLRLNEATSVRPMDLDPERGAVFVLQGKMGKDRWAYADVATLSLGRSLARERGTPVSSPIYSRSNRTLQRHVADLYDHADIAWGPTCHTLRHTCATMQLDRGIDIATVQANMGHEDISVTQIYLHLDIRRRARTCRDAFRWGV